ncbi:transglutaminase-like domain-containing protein [Hymenobacter sp. BRD67]|uniref:transglutaminase-like domain-containing protein n=1 Tax=Hymenobacter sp. BRD67 TaxID=2675877 RepID=UPI0015670946|nr:transglutaminase-like domain-containing protein [Hymenobacter sp. BRD67]QKG51294.1 transglutaminase domain-containing protein [Hymenobacter sp. BRD67]
MRNLLLAAIALLTAAAPAPSASVAPRSRTFQLVCRAAVPAPAAGTRTLEFWMPVPHNDKNQDVRDLKIEVSGFPNRIKLQNIKASDTNAAVPAPYTVETDMYGNKIMHLVVQAASVLQAGVLYDKHMAQQLSKLPAAPIEPLVITLTARITRREHLNLRANSDTAPVEAEATDPNLSRWLAPDRLVPLDFKIKAQAQAVVDKAGAKTDLQKARAIYEHVVSTVTYDKTGQGWGRGDIYYACDARRGNCTDFHAIVIGYCRALGIPARFSIGLPLPAEHGKGEIKGYHCWAEFFTKQTGWVPVDASEAAKNPDRRAYFFGAHDENRVEFTRGRDLTLTPKQAGAPLNYFVYPYAEADGKSVENVEHTYTFEDVEK